MKYSLIIILIMIFSGCMSPQQKKEVVKTENNETVSENKKENTSTITIKETETEIIYYNEDGKIIKVVKKKGKDIIKKDSKSEEQKDMEILETNEAHEDSESSPWYKSLLDYLLLGLVAGLLFIVIWINRFKIFSGIIKGIFKKS